MMIIEEKRDLEIVRRRGLMSTRDYDEEMYRMMNNGNVVCVKNKHSVCAVGRWEYARL